MILKLLILTLAVKGTIDQKGETKPMTTPEGNWVYELPDFIKSARRLKAIEGIGWDKLDPAGETVFGITKINHSHRFALWPPPWTHDSTMFREKPGRKFKSARSFYYNHYWLHLECDAYEFTMAEQLFFFAVNAGRTQAKKELQRAASACLVDSRGRLVIDGKIGPSTHSALKKCNTRALEAAFIATIEGFYRTLKTYPRYGRGWLRKRIYYKR